MMKRSFRDAWSAALRSGKYEQGEGYLCRRGKSCCLGVALFVEGLERPNVSVDGITRFIGEDGGSAFKVPPLSAQARLGLSSELVESLTVSNDLIGLSFPEIADYLDTLPVEDDVSP